MARKRSLDEGPVLRGRIMRRASVLFYERGYAATSIRDIADAVGISSSTMYHHFTNKQEVLHAIIANFMTDFVATTLPVLRDELRTPTERIREIVALHLKISDERRPELLIGNPIRYALNPRQQRDGIAAQAKYHDAVRAVIEEGRATGEFEVADVDLTTMAVLDMLNGVREWFRHSGRLTLDEVIDQYTAMTLKVLGTTYQRLPPESQRNW
ncbi:TetR/AcrR family transcriptional regulator [Saccharopolyspora sp. K220]|uniref:TetR/AcrR family transcriptional regulator n=1 Tax=Saccharopolyspora soli TaxID=2926618 RepID=UPI001F560BFD|nr:TetR/AcrR family transcriptional regulator [Saccharopolyspora soli]MCI2416840.1 TetR/AcrR family transcriptional regulator [Saccharopolyspora soli]